MMKIKRKLLIVGIVYAASLLILFGTTDITTETDYYTGKSETFSIDKSESLEIVVRHELYDEVRNRYSIEKNMWSYVSVIGYEIDEVKVTKPSMFDEKNIGPLVEMEGNTLYINDYVGNHVRYVVSPFISNIQFEDDMMLYNYQSNLYIVMIPKNMKCNVSLK